MKDHLRVALHILCAFHAKHNRKKLIAEYGDLLTQCEQDEPNLRPYALQR